MSLKIRCLMVYLVSTALFLLAGMAWAVNPTITTTRASSQVNNGVVTLKWDGVTLDGSYTGRVTTTPEYRPAGGAWLNGMIVRSTLLLGRLDWSAEAIPADQTPLSWDVRGKATYPGGTVYSGSSSIDNPLN